MYHEIEGNLSIEPIIFDDDELIARGQHYPYSEIESLEITRAPLFSSYGILALRTQGKDHAIPFYRSRKSKLELALRDFNKLWEGGTENRTEGVQTGQTAGRTVSDPYEELKKLKELLDLGIVTEEEFNIKKKKLLDL